MDPSDVNMAETLVNEVLKLKPVTHLYCGRFYFPISAPGNIIYKTLSFNSQNKEFTTGLFFKTNCGDVFFVDIGWSVMKDNFSLSGFIIIKLYENIQITPIKNKQVWITITMSIINNLNKPIKVKINTN